MNADILNMLTAAAQRYGLDPAIVIQQANQESGGEQYNADGSLKVSSAGAIGVMQLMPATAQQLGVDPSDTAQNVDGGVRYLSQLLQQFNGNMQLALAAYNWGPGHVSKNGFLNWPAETTNYVSSILTAAGNTIASAFSSAPAPDPTDSTAPIDSGPDSTTLIGWLLVGGVLIFAAGQLFFGRS